MHLDKKSVLKHSNVEQIDLFTRSKELKTVTVHPISPIPTSHFVYADNALTLTKVALTAPAHQKIDLDFIYSESHAKNAKAKALDSSHKEPADSFVWHTSQANVREAIFHGIWKVSAPTAQVISELGTYRLAVFDRIYDKGIISNKYEQKEGFLRLCQERIEKLQGLERLINRYNDYQTDYEHYSAIIKQFDDYVKGLRALKEKYSQKSAILTRYDQDAITKIEKEIDSDIKAAEEYKTWLKDNLPKNNEAKAFLQNSVVSATGANSLMTFIKNRMYDSIHQLKKHNQNMTYSRSALSLLRGDINSICEDALKLIDDHQSDPHNQILSSHQGIYTQAEEEKQITLDFKKQDQNAKQMRHSMMAIAHIEGLDQIIPTDKEGTHYQLRSGDITQDLKTTRATKWASNYSFKFVVKRAVAWLWNTLTGIVLGLTVDLVIGFITGLVSQFIKLKVPSIAQLVQWTPTNENNKRTVFHELEDRVKIRNPSLGAKLGTMLGTLIKTIFVDTFRTFNLVIKKFKLELFDGIKSDFRIGHYGIPDEADITTEVVAQLKTLNDEHKQIQDEIKSDTKQDLIAKEKIERLIAAAPYELSAGQWNDILNSSSNGVKMFVESFTHEIHTKNPFMGLIFSAVYVTGALAVLNPTWLAFLGPKYLAFCEALGGTVGKAVSSKAISSGLYQAQAAFLILDTVYNGTEGLLAKAVQTFEKDPSNLILYASIAMGVGYLMAFKINIPLLSDELRGDLGTVPPAALIAAGAKVGVLLYELLKPEEEKMGAVMTPEDRRARLKSYIEAGTIDAAKILEDSVKEVLEGTDLFSNLEQNKHLLHHLDHATKRNLIELMRQKYSDNPKMTQAMTQLLFPEKKYSILVATLTTILLYIPMILRCLLSIVTWCKEPWIQLRDKIIKDVTRVFQVMAKMFKIIFDIVKVMVKSLSDIFINEFVARSEGLIKDTEHTVSEASFSVAAGFDKGVIKVREGLGTPLDAMRKASTSAHGYHLTHQQMNKTVHEISKQKPTAKADDHQAIPVEEFKTERNDTRKKIFDKKQRTTFFSQENGIFNGEDLNQENTLVKGLYSKNTHYEIIRDLIINNAKVSDTKKHWNSKKIWQLAVLDQSGRVVIDLLTSKYGREISHRFINDPAMLGNIIKNFHHHPDVLKAISVDKRFMKSDADKIKFERNGVRCSNYFDKDKIEKNFFQDALEVIISDLLKSDEPTPEERKDAINILLSLLKNFSTQRATVDFARKSPKISNLFENKENNVDVEEVIKVLEASANESKKNQL